MQNTYKRLIIDGNNFLFRAFYTDFTKLEGLEKDQSVMRHFFKMLKGVVERFKPEETFFTWDNKLNPDGHNFRNDLADYKGHRKDSPEIAQILALHTPVQEILDNMGIQTIYPYNLEADDVIYWLAQNTDGRNLVVSQDKDLLQLVSDNTDILLASKNLLVNLQNFEMNANIKKDLFVLYKCILGDSSDNVRGLDRYGPVKAKKLAEELYDKKIFCGDDDKDGYLTPEQWLVIENNMKIMDLTYATHFYPEHDKYEEQQKNAKSFNSKTLRELFQKHNLQNCIRQFGEFNRLFNRNQLTESTFDLDSIMDNISL